MAFIVVDDRLCMIELCHKEILCKVWNTKTKKCLKIYSKFNKELKCVVSPGNTSWFLLGVGNEIQKIDAKTGIRQVFLLPETEKLMKNDGLHVVCGIGDMNRLHIHVRCISCHPGGNKFISAHSNKKCYVWDIPTRRCLKSININSCAKCIAYLNDGEHFVVDNCKAPVYSCEIWNVNSNKALFRINPDYDGCVTAVAIYDTWKIVLGLSNGDVCLWDVTGNSINKISRFHYRRIRSIDVLPGGMIVMGSDDMDCSINHVDRLYHVLQKSYSINDYVSSVKVHPDGSKIMINAKYSVQLHFKEYEHFVYDVLIPELARLVIEYEPFQDVVTREFI